MPPPLSQALVGEIFGTYLLVLFGTGSVATAVLTGALHGLWQVAVVWGFGVTLAIYASASLSGAHLNPAVSLALALFLALVLSLVLALVLGGHVVPWVLEYEYECEYEGGYEQEGE